MIVLAAVGVVLVAVLGCCCVVAGAADRRLCELEARVAALEAEVGSDNVVALRR